MKSAEESLVPKNEELSEALMEPTSDRKAPKDTLVKGIDTDVFSEVSVTLSAILGKGSLTVGKLLSLAEGSEIDLDTPLDGKIDLMLNNRLVAQGEIVAVGDKFGVRITKVVAEKK
jgi:flagellar motor switch protein FliN